MLLIRTVLFITCRSLRDANSSKKWHHLLSKDEIKYILSSTDNIYNYTRSNFLLTLGNITTLKCNWNFPQSNLKYRYKNTDIRVQCNNLIHTITIKFCKTHLNFLWTF